MSKTHNEADPHPRGVVVTGGGSGLGQAIALAFARNGDRIAILDRNAEGAARTVELLHSEGSTDSFAIAIDVSSQESVDQAIGEAATRFGAIDAIVNAAGLREISEVLSLSAEDWQKIIAVNLSGTFYSCQAAARLMSESGGGSIINIASVAALEGASQRAAYSASKWGVLGLSRTLAHDLGAANIRVNVICPGLIETPLTASYFQDQGFVAKLPTYIPLGRAGTPADIGEVALFLASPGASYMTGATLTVDGGYLAVKGFGGGSTDGSAYSARTGAV